MDGVVCIAARAADSPEFFDTVAGRRGSVWLDSSYRQGSWGRFSFIARDPVLDFSVYRGVATVTGNGLPAPVSAGVDVLDRLDQLHRENDWFAIGYIAYEAATSFLRLDPLGPWAAIPEVRFLFYNSVLRLDHASPVVNAGGPPDGDLAWRAQSDACSWAEATGDAVEIAPTISREEYLDRVSAVKRHIARGDIYQADFTARFDVTCQSHPYSVYRRLRRLNPSTYGAFMNFGSYHVLSSSPERMFLKEGRHITTSPVKGTIERGRDMEEDAANTQSLLRSAKDRAEHVMIVDVERNDLGKIAEYGSVRVDHLCRPEAFPSMIHLVSDISARLRPEVTLPELFRAMLPGGSISGAPKRRAVEILRELEATPRSVYTGCIGYLYRDTADFNIAIRTMVHQNGCYHVHAGGGIVSDSRADAEYDEMSLKARNLLRALGLEPAGATR